MLKDTLSWASCFIRLQGRPCFILLWFAFAVSLPHCKTPHECRDRWPTQLFRRFSIVGNNRHLPSTLFKTSSLTYPRYSKPHFKGSYLCVSSLQEAPGFWGCNAKNKKKKFPPWMWDGLWTEILDKHNLQIHAIRLCHLKKRWFFKSMMFKLKLRLHKY